MTRSPTQQNRIRRPGRWTLLVLMACGSIASCLYPQPEEPYFVGEAPRKTAGVFAHKDHEEVLKEDRFRCTDCHLYDLAFMDRDKQVNEAVTKAITRAGWESCHFCHREHAEGIKKKLKCLDCHADIRPIRPDDHRVGWRSTHGSKIGVSEVACSQCHSNRFCVACHQQRDIAARRFHKGSALMSHPVEARVDPTRCDRCHTASYCTRCHSFGRF